MYIKYIDNETNYKLQEDDSVLMSLEQFNNDGKELRDVPMTITPNGEEPPEREFSEEEEWN